MGGRGRGLRCVGSLFSQEKGAQEEEVICGGAWPVYVPAGPRHSALGSSGCHFSSSEMMPGTNLCTGTVHTGAGTTASVHVSVSAGK